MFSGLLLAKRSASTAVSMAAVLNFIYPEKERVHEDLCVV